MKVGGTNSDSENSFSPTLRRHEKAKNDQKAVAEPPRNQLHRRKYDVDGDNDISLSTVDRQIKGHRLSDIEIHRWVIEKDNDGRALSVLRTSWWKLQHMTLFASCSSCVSSHKSRSCDLRLQVAVEFFCCSIVLHRKRKVNKLDRSFVRC